ncbi:formate dehydrogenase accessory sulfurtransferase FdhD [Dermacoccus nishinomiyaensis]|uniref:formate dehydrogenase accessory sulfurtransferase FdhD n=1 Tax=Dermacoccus nishinomiyaensis TaxID=1274 RepID=UPI000DB41CF3|nr:formate dehydrogenase accessory sulfurtransferase FdhD [Dermacoccus nishinomiyaensis]PZP02437.1 MAG: formate dehydrogenase accessory sulfurtransferase FdhD [Dermacoccus nishinomiyaensis]QQY23517.1 formate dehydrogenase accessory sulfurtransferase FdhD [Dermacoccus nishinomiyaensis]STD15369.1 formate dehydrogenase accessory protein [Dermacoccus nishinomiyaensis]
MTTRRPVHRINAGGMSRRPDDLVVEAPLELHLDDTTLAVLMRTPGHDTELAAGWLLVESGTSAPEHIRQLRGCWKNETDAIEITLAAGVEPPRPRSFVTGAACGVCSADQLTLGPAIATCEKVLSADVARELPDALRRGQRAFERTGGLHAAALATYDGVLGPVREDVGRHNAVDKVLGRALMEGELPATDRLLVVSGRVSFEIVQKAVAAGVSGIVAVSAPSSMAVDLCEEYGLVLVGMMRRDHFNVYAGADRVSA